MKKLYQKLSYRDFRRKWTSRAMVVFIIFLAALAIVPLLSVFVYVMQKGAPALGWDFFIQLPRPVGETGGGMSNALIGSGILVLLASAVGIPWGIAAGIYFSEYKTSRVVTILRFLTDVLTSIPSIIIGLFAYSVFVMPMKGFSAYAGGAALAVIMIPMVARTTEEMIKLVPQHIREAGLALGIPRWKVTLRIVLRGSLGGVVTGVMLAVARVAGETAPLLFTAFNNQFSFKGLDQPTASLPVQIYTYAISPYEDWHRQAWAGAFVLVFFVFLFNLMTRIAIARKK